MQIEQGYAYHIKDEFFNIVNDKLLMSNKEDNHYRPHYYAIEDSKEQGIYWMIPISSKVEKYKHIISKKVARYGKCNTIIIGIFGGKENAFLIQNAFPIHPFFLDHIHTIESKPIRVHKALDKSLKVCLKQIISLNKKGIKCLYCDVDAIMSIMKSYNS